MARIYKKPKRFYYKVVRVLPNKNLASMIPDIGNRVFSLRYKVGEWTEANVGKIFIYESLVDALYSKVGSRHKIFKCVAEEVEGMPTDFVNNLNESSWRAEWRRFFNFYYSKFTQSKTRGGYFPDGTLLAKRVKLVKEVK